MNAAPLLKRLEQLQSLLLQTLTRLGDATYRQLPHPALSPAGWHLGHCIYTEARWLHAAIPGRPPPARKIRELYDAMHSVKQERHRKLPQFTQLMSWAHQQQQEHRRMLGLAGGIQQHSLLRDHYLLHFLIQHNAQHYETLCMVEAQLKKPIPDSRPSGNWEQRRYAPSIRRGVVALASGAYQVGNTTEHAPYDNEHLAHTVQLDYLNFAKRPVSNAEYLDFIGAGGYRNPEYWSKTGWEWRQRHSVGIPGYWSFSTADGWLQFTAEGARALHLREPVCGISHYEASAYAAWAGGRLPHEYEWEAARQARILEQCGRVWEWCSNTLHPYPGFKPFPYLEYSTPYFDGNHYVLRGGSRYTCRELRRSSFRNYYAPDTRHLFAGLRLVFPAS